jgi:hypothetical protein
MEASPLSREEIAADDLPEQRVAECDVRIPSPASRDEDSPVDRLAQGVADRGERTFRDGGQQLVVDSGAGRCGHAEHRLPVRGNRRETRQHDVAKPRRQYLPTRLLRGREQLFRVERVAAGALPDAVGELPIWWPAELVAFSR